MTYGVKVLDWLHTLVIQFLYHGKSFSSLGRFCCMCGARMEAFLSRLSWEESCLVDQGRRNLRYETY